MKSTVRIISLLCLVIGLFVSPMLLLIGAVLFLVSVGLAPEGTRADGKPKTGGLLGGLWDAYAVSVSTKKCPHCAELVKTEATVCKHCGRDLPA